MMRHTLTTLAALVLSCTAVLATPTRVTVNFGNYKLANRATIKLRDTGVRLTEDMDSERVVRFTIDVDQPTYASLSIGTSIDQLYITPGKDMTVSVVPIPGDEHKAYNLVQLNLEFQGGDVRMNNYLNQFKYTTIADSCYLLPEQEYIDLIEKTIASDCKVIKKYKLSKEQERHEMDRDKYHLYEIMARYPVQHFWKGGNYVNVLYKHDDPLTTVRNYIAQQFVDTPEAWQNAKYRRFVQSAISVLSDDEFSSNWDKVMKLRLDYTFAHFQTPVILEDLVQHFALAYTEAKQADTLGDYAGVYDQYVHRQELREKLATAQALYKSVSQGAAVLSADAPYQTIDGKTLSLADLRGKYLFIDVWATWCGPCRAEIPSLRKLEEKYKGRNIEFVSISVDNTVAPWSRMVKADKMGGLQLWGGPNAPICKDYGITSIPRFILIDPQGNMVNSDMTRPSAPATDEFLSTLKGL